MNPSAETPPTVQPPDAEIRDLPAIRRSAAAESARVEAPDRSIREARCFFQRFG